MGRDEGGEVKESRGDVKREVKFGKENDQLARY
jgi:hypothetical protein